MALNWLERNQKAIADGKTRVITCYNCKAKFSALNYSADKPMAKACTECGALLRVPQELVELVWKWNWLDGEEHYLGIGQQMSWMTVKEAKAKEKELLASIDKAKKKVVAKYVKEIENAQNYA